MQNKICSICLFECGLPHSGFLVWTLQIHNGFHFLQKEASLMRCGIYTHLWVYDLLRHGQRVSFKIRIPSYGAGIQSHYSPIGYPQGKIHTAVSLMEVLLGCSSLWAQASQLGNVANYFFPQAVCSLPTTLEYCESRPSWRRLSGQFQVNSFKSAAVEFYFQVLGGKQRHKFLQDVWSLFRDKNPIIILLYCKKYFLM